MRWAGIALTFASAMALGLASVARAGAEDKILYRYRVDDQCTAPKPPRWPIMIFDGRFGVLAPFQKALTEKLVACGVAMPLASDGLFGCGVKKAITRLGQCPQVKPKLPTGSSAFQGDVTEAVWREIMPDTPVPDLEMRIKTLVLSFERTDYSRIEWNFCQYTNQGKEVYDPNVAGSQCKTNDQNSFLTWGPRGATAGGGREVQNILWTLKQQNAEKLRAALGADEAEIMDLVGLSRCHTELYLCAKWVEPTNRDKWQAAFRRLAEVPEARKTFDEYYKSVKSDGSKIRAFFSLYRLLKVKPSEIDYAFFVDRATHTKGLGDEPAKIAKQVTNFVGAKKDNWRIRRALSIVAPVTGDQKKDRLGRDVTFFIDAVGEANLEEDETAAWTDRGGLKASDFGLSDTVLVDEPQVPAWAVDPPEEGSKTLPNGLAQCPTEVLLRRDKAGTPKAKNTCFPK